MTQFLLLLFTAQGIRYGKITLWMGGFVTIGTPGFNGSQAAGIWHPQWKNTPIQPNRYARRG